MDNQNNIGNQNTIQKEQDQIGQLLQIPKKSRINYFALLIAPVIVLIVFLTTTLAPFFLRKNNSSQIALPTQTLIPNTTNTPTITANELLTENEFNTIFVFKQDENTLWNEEEKTEVKSLLKLFYLVVRNIYGERFSTSEKIQLSKLNSTTNETSYAQTPNNMFLVFPLSKDTLIHELIHLFHYPNARLNSTYEEGFARAVEIEGLKRIYGTALRDFNSGDAIFYDLYRTQALSNGLGSINSGSADIQIERYNLVAFAFSKAYYEDPLFFKNYNEEVYRRVKNNTFSVEDLDKIFEKVKPTMENIQTDIWISQQGLIDYKHTQIGNHIFISGLCSANNFQLIERLEGGFERNRGRDASDSISTAPMELQYFDYNGNLIDTQTIMLSYGKISIDDKKKENLVIPGRYEPKFLPDYFGYYRVKASIANSKEQYKSESYGLYPCVENTNGIMGIVPGINTGTVSVYDVKGINKIADANVVGGRFYIDAKERGMYKIVINNENRTRYITKDDNPIVVLVQ